MPLCENNCEYISYNFNEKKVLCECFAKTNLPLISEIDTSIDKLLNSFIDIKNTINANVMKCYEELFTKEGINNLGFYIIGSIIVISYILSILFEIKGYNKIKFLINEIIKRKYKFKNNSWKKINNKIKIYKNLKNNDEIIDKTTKVLSRQYSEKHSSTFALMKI